MTYQPAVPRVSILLAVHNGERFLAEAIQSVVGQTYPHWELIVVSNGSSDDTWRICEAWRARDPRIRGFELPEQGKNAAYNLAYREATGDYFCFFAADDLLPRESLATRVYALDGGSRRCYCTCRVKTISADPKYADIVFPRSARRPNYSGGSLLFSRDLAERVFPLPPGQPNEDTWTALHLRAFGEHRQLHQALYFYRIHEGNSYGYGVSFEKKRAAFLRRMHAYQLFHDKYRHQGVPFVDQEVRPFLEGLNAAREKRMWKVWLVNGLSLRHRMMLAFYCSPTLYRIRHTFFRTFSGGVGHA